MTNKQIVRYVKVYREARQGWMDVLGERPDSVEAAQYVLSINTKIDLLLTMWDWSDESVEFPYPWA